METSNDKLLQENHSLRQRISILENACEHFEKQIQEMEEKRTDNRNDIARDNGLDPDRALLQHLRKEASDLANGLEATQIREEEIRKNADVWERRAKDLQLELDEMIRLRSEESTLTTASERDLPVLRQLEFLLEDERGVQASLREQLSGIIQHLEKTVHEKDELKDELIHLTDAHHADQKALDQLEREVQEHKVEIFDLKSTIPVPVANTGNSLYSELDDRRVTAELLLKELQEMYAKLNAKYLEKLAEFEQYRSHANKINAEFREHNDTKPELIFHILNAQIQQLTKELKLLRDLVAHKDHLKMEHLEAEYDKILLMIYDPKTTQALVAFQKTQIARMEGDLGTARNALLEQQALARELGGLNIQLNKKLSRLSRQLDMTLIDKKNYQDELEVNRMRDSTSNSIGNIMGEHTVQQVPTTAEPLRPPAKRSSRPDGLQQQQRSLRRSAAKTEKLSATAVHQNGKNDDDCVIC